MAKFSYWSVWVRVGAILGTFAVFGGMGLVSAACSDYGYWNKDDLEGSGSGTTEDPEVVETSCETNPLVLGYAATDIVCVATSSGTIFTSTDDGTDICTSTQTSIASALSSLSTHSTPKVILLESTTFFESLQLTSTYSNTLIYGCGSTVIQAPSGSSVSTHTVTVDSATDIGIYNLKIKGLGSCSGCSEEVSAADSYNVATLYVNDVQDSSADTDEDGFVLQDVTLDENYFRAAFFKSSVADVSQSSVGSVTDLRTSGSSDYGSSWRSIGLQNHSGSILNVTDFTNTEALDLAIVNSYGILTVAGSTTISSAEIAGIATVDADRADIDAGSFTSNRIDIFSSNTAALAVSADLSSNTALVACLYDSEEDNTNYSNYSASDYTVEIDGGEIVGNVWLEEVTASGEASVIEAIPEPYKVYVDDAILGTGFSGIATEDVDIDPCVSVSSQY